MPASHHPPSITLPTNSKPEYLFLEIYCQQSISMGKALQLLLLFVFATAVLTRNLQTVYEVIIIGAGAAGIGASLSLASKNVNHIILQARNRTGGRLYATSLSGVTVDLGASFIHNPQTNNAIDTYVKNLNWGTTLANFDNSELLYQSGNQLSDSDQTTAGTLLKNFVSYATTLVANGTDIGLLDAWNKYNASGYSSAVLNRVLFELYLQANLNGADLNTVSTIAYTSVSGYDAKDYLPATSYAALLQAIYSAYCKNATIMTNQVVTNIDYSGSVVKITTAGGQIYYANKVINTIPLGVLKSGAVTFNPALPAAYQSAIANIGMGVFNKIIVTLNTTFWSDTTNTRIVDMVFQPNSTTLFPQFYIAPTNPAVLLFFVSGNASALFNSKSDADIIASLQATINLYATNPVGITNYTITRWEQQIYSLGSYSYYKVGTTASCFKTLMTSINNKLWFAGEHVHPNQSSNVHGAFQTGLWAGQGALFGVWQLLSVIWLLFLIFVA